MLKGTAAVLIAGIYGRKLRMVAGFGAFLGHLFPVWLGFKGGKGVATYLGVLIGLAWQVALVFAAVWLAVAFLLRYSSLAALTAAHRRAGRAVSSSGSSQLALMFALMSVHRLPQAPRQHIARLLAGNGDPYRSQGVTGEPAGPRLSPTGSGSTGCA